MIFGSSQNYAITTASNVSVSPEGGSAVSLCVLQLHAQLV